MGNRHGVRLQRERAHHHLRKLHDFEDFSVEGDDKVDEDVVLFYEVLFELADSVVGGEEVAGAVGAGGDVGEVGAEEAGVDAFAGAHAGVEALQEALAEEVSVALLVGGEVEEVLLGNSGYGGVDIFYKIYYSFLLLFVIFFIYIIIIINNL